MRRVRIHAAAGEEAAEAAAWYERERSGLGVEFEQAVDAALDLLEEERRFRNMPFLIRQVGATD